MKNPASCFLDKKRKSAIRIVPVAEKSFPAWLKKAPDKMQKAAAEKSYEGQPGKILIVRNADGGMESVVLGLSDPVSLYDIAPLVQALRIDYAREFLDKTGFALETKGLKKDSIEALHLGWVLACYEFAAYKKSAEKIPALVRDKKADQRRIAAFAESIFLIRDMVNTPSNDMGPEEIEGAARKLAVRHKAKIAVIKGAELKKDFPLVHAVGQGSPRAPRLIDLAWGSAKNPKLTLVGKGVAFDTGGLNIKPTASMALMKKDMGGAAHVLALGHMIMSLGLKLRLRIIIPAVENAVSGASFRPGDIFTSRKGLTVENTNTDAEGRLILADALAFACEDKPDLLIDFATLTGSARAALGPDIPALFTNAPKLGETAAKLSFAAEDPVWPMPLWTAYRKHLDSSVADILNSSSTPGDLMYSALFLYEFIKGADEPDWIHLDTYSWEHTGRPGRPKGGADCGLRAVFAMLETRYS